MSDLHPHALSLDEDALHASDFAQDLAADLARMSPPDVIHRYRIVAPGDQQTTTLVTNGFAAVRLTHIVDLPLDVLDHAALSGPSPDQLAPHWFARGERAPWTQWVDAHWRHYCATHISNPPQIPPDGIGRVFISDDLIEGFALRAGPQGRLKGFSSLRDGQEIGWIGAAPGVLPAVLAASLRRAAAIGWTNARVEVDDDDRALWALIADLDIAPVQTYVTWQRERQSANRVS